MKQLFVVYYDYPYKCNAYEQNDLEIITLKLNKEHFQLFYEWDCKAEWTKSYEDNDLFKKILTEIESIKEKLKSYIDKYDHIIICRQSDMHVLK